MMLSQVGQTAKPFNPFKEISEGVEASQGQS